MTIMFISNPLEQQLCSFPNLEFWMEKNTIKNLIYAYIHVFMATFWNFDPNYSLPHVTQDSLPKKFLIVDFKSAPENFWKESKG